MVSGHQVTRVITLLLPVRFMVLPSAFSQVIGVLASSRPQVTLWGLTLSPAWRALKLVASQS